MSIRNSSRISFLIKISLLIVSILIAFFIAELSMRVYGKINDIDFRLYTKELKNSVRIPLDLYIPDDLLYYKMKPDAWALVTTSDFSVIYRINSKGLRDKEYGYIKPKDKIRVLAFGDSFTFGEGVEYGKRFTDIAEDHFSNLEIINFGVPGWSLEQELLYFSTEGLKYSPDYVIVFVNQLAVNRCFSEGIKNFSVAVNRVASGGQAGNPSTIFLKKDDIFFKTGISPIVRKSYLLSYLGYRLTLVRLKNRLVRQDRLMWDSISRVPEVTEKLFEDKRLRERARAIITEFNEICRKNNIKLIVINIDPWKSLDYMGKISQDILYYDLNEGLRGESKKYRRVFKYDLHYNPRTNHYIGRRVVEILADIFNLHSHKKEKSLT